MSSQGTMLAAQLQTPGPPSALQLVQLPIPIPQPGQVLIRVKAFGLNRAEILARKFGRMPVGEVKLPRVLGIEAAGVVEAAPGKEAEFPRGAIAMTAVGGMGLLFDGGYAQYTCVAAENVQIVKSTTAVDKLGWSVLGALPELLQVAHGSLYRSLNLKPGDSLLIRGATTSIGMAAAAIAKAAGAEVLATTRKSDEATTATLKENGASHVLQDDGSPLQPLVARTHPQGVNNVLELVGGTTLVDSLSCLAPGGTCCVTGIVGGVPTVADFNPLFMIPTGRYLTSFAERNFAASNLPLDDLIRQIEDGSLNIRVGRTFNLEQIVEAHECMERNESNGKIVVLTGM